MKKLDASNVLNHTKFHGKITTTKTEYKTLEDAMTKLKVYLAVLLVAAIFTVSGTDPTWAKKSDVVIVLDAGHGGYDSGAVGNGLYEKILTLKIAQYCKAELEQYDGVKVYMTRSNDTFVSLDQRVASAAGVRADAFVSLHINSAASSAAGGAEVFYPNSSYRPALSMQGRKLANAIQGNLVSLGLRNRGLKTLNSMIGSKYPDGSIADYYAVIRGAKNAGFPGIIVEHAFISNAADAKTFLGSSAALKRLGVADAKGIAACYGLKKTGTDTNKLPKTKLNALYGKTSGSVSIGWEKVKEASGYEIFRSDAKNGGYQKVAAVKKAKTVKYTDKSVESGRTYYYKVRPYKIVNGSRITAGFSAAQKVKLLKKPDISVSGSAASATKVRWKKVEGALRYEIYRSASKKGRYQKIATVQNGTFYKDVNKKSNRTYYYKIRAVSNGVRGNTYSSYGMQ